MLSEEEARRAAEAIYEMGSAADGAIVSPEVWRELQIIEVRDAVKSDAAVATPTNGGQVFTVGPPPAPGSWSNIER